MFFQAIFQKLVQIGSDVRGSIIPLFAMASPVLMLSAGLAVDYSIMYHQKTELQAIADNAVLAGAKQITLAQNSDAQVTSMTKSFLEEGIANTANNFGGQTEYKIDVDNAAGTVTATLKRTWKPFFAQFFSNKVTPLVITAVGAITKTHGNICVLALEERDARSVNLKHTSKISANGCAIMANSIDPKAIEVEGQSKLIAGSICSSGGYQGSPSAFSPLPQTDCPAFADPLASLPTPAVGPCNYSNKKVNGGIVTLNPGVYCGGLEISGNAEVTFNPGIYIIKGPKFRVSGNAKIEGVGVGFYLVNGDTHFHFTRNTEVNLEAPVSGPMAGLLFFGSRASNSGDKSTISSNGVERMVGTIYLPRSNLIIDSQESVAEGSEFTVIIAQNIRMMHNPQLVLNTDYGATPVPVPAGIIGGSKVRLKQ